MKFTIGLGRWGACFCLFLAWATSDAFAKKTELWLYTSVYKEFVAPIEKAFETKYPDIDVQVFQGGSEKLQAKVEAELLANRPQADIVLSSDPFWGVDMERRGLLYTRPGRPQVETNYYSLMVLICNKDLPVTQRPKSFADLTQPHFKGLIQAGSPLESGTTFTTVAYLSKKYGWDFFEKLRANQLASAGGNSTVVQKVESGEKKIGLVLLENALAAKKRGSPIEIIYPSDGGVPIPNIQLILKSSPRKEAADLFATYILSKEGQGLLRNGYMYSVRSDVAPPEGAKAWKEVTSGSNAWTAEGLREIAQGSREIKRKFSELILE